MLFLQAFCFPLRQGGELALLLPVNASLLLEAAVFSLLQDSLLGFDLLGDGGGLGSLKGLKK